jgi:outer membrane protein assembly factor BamB
MRVDQLLNSVSGLDGSFEEVDLVTRRAPMSTLRRPHPANCPTLLFLAALAFGAQPARAGVAEAWVQRYSNVLSNSKDYALRILCDAAGDIIVVGATGDSVNASDMLTIKYSGTNGSVLWQNRYNGPTSSDDGIDGLAVDASGNAIVSAYSWNDGYYTAKYAAADGALLWEKRGLGAVALVDSGGNIIVTGSAYYVAKYAAADGALLWGKHYNSPVSGDDVLHTVAVDGGGNVIVTGLSDTNSYTAKYAAADGALLWEKRGPRLDASDLAVDANGNVAVTGSSFNGFGDDYYTAKYASPDGLLLWEQRHSGPGTQRAMALDANGDVIVTGSSATAKYAAADGALLWQQGLGGAAVAVDDGGSVVVTGGSYNGTNYDYYTAKYAAADGALLWEKRYNGPGNNWDASSAVAVDGSGNVLVTGESSGNGSGADFYTAKYATTNGALLWEKRYNGPAYNDDHASAVAVDNSGNVIVTGTSLSDSGDFGLGFGFYTAYAGGYTAKYSAQGALLWGTRYSGIYCSSIGVALTLDAAGNAIVAGHFYNCNAGGDPNESYVAKYAAVDGAVLWEKRDHGGEPAAVAVDSGGNVVVTRGYRNGNTYYTAKYAAVDGTLLWEKLGPSGTIDAVVALDASGNVMVSGTSLDGIQDIHYTAKYAASDGSLLWEKRGVAGFARAVAVDGSGNAIVTGAWCCGASGIEFYTAKYATSDGALLWEKRGPGGQGNAVAVDANGNVAVTGSSSGTNSSVDYYTAKYAAADGALLWEQRGPRLGASLLAVALDGSGNVIVTGSSDNGTNYDYYTAKYAATDGSLLWEQRYNGPANGNDFVGGSRSLALGPNGMVAIAGSSEGRFGYEYAIIVYRENLPPVSIELSPNGTRIRFTGVTGRTYTIERAPSVTGPWSTIATPTTPVNGIIEYIDTNLPAGGAFYRTRQAMD